jgi:hypothetical protein
MSMAENGDRLTIWTEAWMQGEGICVQGIGNKQPEDHLTVSANGREWQVVVILTVTGGMDHPIWKAIDEKRWETNNTRILNEEWETA